MSFVDSKTTGVFRDISDLDPQVQKRIRMERRIVKLTVKTMLAAGYVLSVNNGGDDNEISNSTDEKAVLSAMMETDEERLYAKKDGKVKEIFLVYGNDGWDALCDYSGSLEEELKPVNELIDKLQEE